MDDATLSNTSGDAEVSPLTAYWLAVVSFNNGSNAYIPDTTPFVH